MPRATLPIPRPHLGAVVAWRTGALGDFVLTLPVLDALRRRARHLTVIAPSRYATLLAPVDRWIDADGLDAAALIGGRARLPADLGVAWTPTAADALAQAGVTEVRRGTAHPPPGVHQADALWAPLADRLGPRDRDPTVPAGPDHRVAAHRGAIAIAPGSGGARKRLPIGFWREVADRCAGPVVWVGGPQEASEPGWGAPRRDDLDLADLVALAAGCRAWLGPDAGPQHLAAAAGARVGVVFNGATDPANWAPCGARVFGADATPEALAAWALAPPAPPA